MFQEHFLNYELRNKNNAKTGKNIDNKDKVEEDISSQDSKYMKALQILELGNDDFLDISSLNQSDLVLDKMISELLNKESKVSDEVMTKILMYYKNNVTNIKRFI